ncbi:hypothetical protein AGMMS49521_1470 [Campylobacterota bacterium]|nr:hypothetical protein AGMMS49521_1470 [Campylobacterota bacterium]
MRERLTKLKKLSKLYELNDRGVVYWSGFAAESSAPIEANSAEIHEMIPQCQLCRLAKVRENALAMSLSAAPKIMIVVDEPSAHENQAGRWFVGAGGEMLQNMIERGMRLTLDDVCVTAAVKCHSAGGAGGDELMRCKPYLVAEIEDVKPAVILALGDRAFFAITGVPEKIEAAREKIWSYGDRKIPVVASFSIAYLRLNPSAKKAAMNDLQLALSKVCR